MTDKMLEAIITQADLLMLDAQYDDNRVEIEDGQIILGERAMTYWHHKIIENLYDLLKPYAKLHHLGYVHSDGFRYIITKTNTSITTAYVPDLSFIRKETFPENFVFDSDFIGAPALAVEVISRGQSYAQQLNKISRYLEAGSDEAWLIHPDQHVLYQHKQAGEAFRYGISDILTSDLFPNLKIALHDIFTPAP
ncbi:MAG: Uma2 family endonuclease [Phototrophicales bacterium]|nr:Uma2 family endonuclease [Phototrophicales bacterium]